MDLEQFIVACGLDESAAQRLREVPIEVQAAVIAEGAWKSQNVRNPSAFVASRIKNAIAKLGDDVPWNPNGRGGLVGKVKLWNADKGWGFITMADGNDIFCHHGDIGGRVLIKGGSVTFDLGRNDNGNPKAINVSGDVGPRSPAAQAKSQPQAASTFTGEEWRDWAQPGMQNAPLGVPGGMNPSVDPTTGMPSMPVAPMLSPEMQAPCEPWNPAGGGLLVGTVKMWSPDKGFGFIINNQSQEEIFCHHSDIGGRSLIKGGTVTYDIGHNEMLGKPKAINISGDVGPRIHNGEGKGWPPKGVDVPADQQPGMAAGGRGGMAATPPGPYGAAAAGFGANPVFGTKTTCAEVHVTVPQGHAAGEKVRFALGGYAYEVDVPASKAGMVGQKFVVNL